jgi:amino acid transporter
MAGVERLKRKLSLFDVICIGVNSTVGSGVFAMPDDMHRAMGGFSPFAYVLCATLLLPVALCFAELSGRVPESGGAYVFAHRAFGDRVGFLVGWYCWLATFIAWAANTTLFFELLGLQSTVANKLASVSLIVVLGAVNYFGVKPGAWLVNLVTVAKLGAILAFLIVAIGVIDPARLGGRMPAMGGVGTGVYLALFPLQGFEVTPVPASETANPRRNVPIATIAALVFSALLFVLVQAAMEGSYANIAAESQTPLVDAARALGPRIGLIVLVGSFISIGGFNAGSALGAPRYAQAIAAHGLLPRRLADVHARWATPHIAIIATTLLAALLAVRFDYRQLVGMSNVSVVVQYTAACAAVPFVRKKMEADKNAAPYAGFQVPFGVVLPVLGALGSLALLAGTERDEWKFAGASLVAGALVALALRRRPSKPADA